MENLHKTKDELIQEKLYQILRTRDENVVEDSPYHTFEQKLNDNKPSTSGENTENGR